MTPLETMEETRTLQPNPIEDDEHSLISAGPHFVGAMQGSIVSAAPHKAGPMQELMHRTSNDKGRHQRSKSTSGTDATHSAKASPQQEGMALSKVIALTMQLKEQVSTLQSEVLEQKDKLVLTEQLKDQVIKLQGEVSEQKTQISAAQKEVSALSRAASAGKRVGQIVGDGLRSLSPTRSVSPKKKTQFEDIACPPLPPPQEVNEAVPFPTQENCLIDLSPDTLTSPAGAHRLGKMFNSGLRCLSPARSLSPKKSVHADTDDIQPSFCQSPSRSISPDRHQSPSRRIEARLAPRILSNMTSFVDGQIQNLELRMVEMEKSFEKWGQSVVPDGAVDGMAASDLQMLSGLNVIKSRVGDLPKENLSESLLGPSAESVWDLPSCSAPHAKMRTSSERKSASKRDKSSSWKRFFRRST